MKVFNCVCQYGHAFEGWFDSVESLDEQIGQGLVACPYCDTTDVKRVPTASYVLPSRDKEKTDYTQREFEDMLRHKAIASARKLLKDSVDVGEQFPQEARAVHQGKSPKRTIHGRCTADEALELLEEGIPVLPLPEGTVRTTN